MNPTQVKELSVAFAEAQQKLHALRDTIVRDFSEVTSLINYAGAAVSGRRAAELQPLEQALKVLEAGRTAIANEGTFAEFVAMCVSQREYLRTDMYDSLEAVYQMAGREMPESVEEKMLESDKVIAGHLGEYVQVLATLGIDAGYTPE